MIMEDLRGLLAELEQEHQMAPISVELVDNELAKIYANSNKAQVHTGVTLQATGIEFWSLCMLPLVVLKEHLNAFMNYWSLKHFDIVSFSLPYTRSSVICFYV